MDKKNFYREYAAFRRAIWWTQNNDTKFRSREAAEFEAKVIEKKGGFESHGEGYTLPMGPLTVVYGHDEYLSWHQIRPDTMAAHQSVLDALGWNKFKFSGQKMPLQGPKGRLP